MSARLLMQGYYGHGNFGDDLLMQVTHRLLGEEFPTAEIAALTPGAGKDYVSRMLSGAPTLAPGRHGRFDAIIHGGGGVFFDFAPASAAARMLEKAIRTIGFPHYLKLENTLRHSLGREHTHAACRIGIGIGVGRYTPGSKAFRAALPMMATMDGLWLRDAASLDAMQQFDSVYRGQTWRGSDLAFLTNYWLNEQIENRNKNNDKKKVGIALRDWKTVNYSTLSPLLSTLASPYTLEGLLLDARADARMGETLAAASIPTTVWQPETQTIGAFAAKIAAQDVLLTSRAHGAIVAACLGVPSVLVAIEPKLQQVHAMLPNSTLLVAPDAPETWPDALATAARITPVAIAADVARSRAESLAAWERTRALLHRKLAL
jgi:polysaccharide pyruvyl transferase WcaK-like protein